MNFHTPVNTVIIMTSEYPSDWDSRRKDVYQRDGYQCQNCDASGGTSGSATLHAHHIVPKSKGGTHQRSNLITVCEDCHNAIHGNSNAPTHSATGSSISSEKELIVSIVSILKKISESEENSNNAMADLLVLLDSWENESNIKEYREIREDIIDNAFSTKEKIEQYESNTREYLQSEAKSDIDSYTDAAWASIQSKITVIGRVDDLLMEFVDREIECTECGEIVDSESEFCKNCGKKIMIEPQCTSCGRLLDEDINFCPGCGTEVEVSELDKQTSVSENDLTEHADSIGAEIKEAMQRAALVQLLQAKFAAVWMKNYDVLWEYCPNCGLDRGVLYKSSQANCVLCGAKWKKKGILNRYWNPVDLPDAEIEQSADEVNWNVLGNEKNSEKVYEDKLPELVDKLGKAGP